VPPVSVSAAGGAGAEAVRGGRAGWDAGAGVCAGVVADGGAGAGLPSVPAVPPFPEAAVAVSVAGGAAYGTSPDSSGSGSTAHAEHDAAPRRTSKCRCAAELEPVEPTSPMTCPRLTRAPGRTLAATLLMCA